MSDQPNSLFDITHSLPVLAHSLAVATRSPSAGYQQASKFMPEYGGVMEVPSSCIKNNALMRGLPFGLEPYRFKIESDRPLGTSYTEYSKTPDCLFLSVYLSSYQDNQFSTFRAIKNDLLIDSVSQIYNGSGDSYSCKSVNYARESFTEPITGIKITPSAPDRLLVKTESTVQAIKLKSSYTLQDGTDQDPYPSSNQESFESTSSFISLPSYTVRDACWNPFNENFLAVVSDNECDHNISLYDFAQTQQEPFQTIPWTDSADNHLRSRSKQRIYVPTKTTRLATQQIDNIPSHLINMLVTTSNQTVLLDPRSNSIGQVYVDKTKLPTFYPIEYIKRTEFSPQNNYQFYSLSNVHLRAFDTRFPGVPVNQLNHMLDSEAYDSMNMRVVVNPGNHLETVCLSTPDRLCFLTFDQSQQTSLVNPKSVHLPYHDIDEAIYQREEKYSGLAVRACDDRTTNELFATYQLARDGDICVRKFIEATTDCDMEVESDKLVRMMVEESRTRAKPRPEFSRLDNPSVIETEAPVSLAIIEHGVEPLDLLEIDEFTENLKRFKSHRVHERANKLKSQLDSV